MNKRVMLLGALAVAIAQLVRADQYDETTGYVTMLRNDSEDVRSLAAIGNWSDGLAPHDNPPTNYYVRAGWTAQGPADNMMFPSLLMVAGDVRCRGGNGKTGTFKDLRILADGGIKFSDDGKVAGKITFLSEDAEHPSCIRYIRQNFNSVKLGAEVIGSEQSQVYFYQFVSSYKGLSYLLPESGSDWTKFSGIFRFADGFGMKIPASTSFVTPGTFVFGNKAWLDISAKSDFGNLSFAENSSLTNSAQLDVAGTLNTGMNMQWQSVRGDSRISTVGTFVVGNGSCLNFTKGTGMPEMFYVTNRLEIGSQVRMCYKDMNTTAESGGDPVEFPMFRLSPQAVAAGLPDFTGLNATMDTYMGMLPFFTVNMRDDDEVVGGKYVCLSHRKVVSYCGVDQQNESNCKMDTSVSQEGVWSDGRWPHSDADYYVGRSRSGSVMSGSIAFRAPTATYPNRVTTFPGGGLCVGPEGVVYLYASSYITNLHTFGTAYIYPRVSCRLKGKWTLHRYPAAGQEAVVRMYNDSSFHLESELTGDGDINAECYYPDSAGASLYLSAINTNWTGGIVTKWTQNPNSLLTASETAHTRIVVDDGRSLGGALGAFRHDSLLLKDYAELCVTNPVTFAEETRGFSIEGNGAVHVAKGVSASFCAPLTLNGVLRKTGGGILSLGGVLRFGQNDDLADSTEPSDISNIIKVKEGAVKVALFKALDGAAIDFAAGTSLRVDLHPADSAMQMKGFCFTNDKSSFSCTERLVVVFEGGTKGEYEQGVAVPLCTVAPGRAEALMNKLIPRIAIDGGTRPGSLSYEVNDDGSETVFAKFRQKGLIIGVR